MTQVTSPLRFRLRPQDATSTFGPIAALPPYVFVIALAALNIVLWSVIPALVHAALPIDVAEGYLWGREGLILTAKHPNFPGLLLDLSYRLTGSHGWPAYVLSQLCVAATYALVYCLGRDLLGRRAGAAGAILLAGCYYFTWPTPEFNHNVAQMPIWAAFCYALWKAIERNALRLWLILGAIAALGMYVKFSVALLLASGVCWLLYDRQARSRLATPGPWLALVVFLVATAPLALHLAQLNFLPLDYALSRSTSVTSGFALIVGAQAADMAGFAAIAAIAFLWPRKATTAALDAGASEEPIAERARAFLFVFTALPLAATCLIAIIFGAKATWTAPMYNLAGLLLVSIWHRQFRPDVFSRLAALGLTVASVVPLAYAATHVIGAQFAFQSRPPLRTLWPEAQIAQSMAQKWSSATKAPLGIVGGDPAIAALIAQSATDQASFYPDLDERQSPWITAARLRSQGLLIVWEERGGGPPAGWRSIIAGRPQGVEAFDWSNADNALPIKVGFAIVPPIPP